MRAFHNDPDIKTSYIERLEAHAKADEIIKGSYWENGKGCAIGCTLHSANHSQYEIELGIPRILAYLEDRIFENLPNELAKKWPIKFLESINIGADLSKIWPKFAYWLLVDPIYGIIRFNKDKSILYIADLFIRKINDEKINSREWESAAYAAAYAYAYASAASAGAASAASAACYAAASAAYADSAAAAYACAAASAAYASAAASACAASAAAYASAADSAASASASATIKHFVIMADKLSSLLEQEL